MCLSSSYHRSKRCGRLNADGYAHHAYTQRSGPGYVAASSNDVNIGTLSRLTTALDRAGRTGAIRRSMPIYLTEFGIQSYPDPYAGVSLSKQAQFLSVSEWIAYRNPRVRSFSQYLHARRRSPAGQAPRRATAGSSRGCGARTGERSRPTTRFARRSWWIAAGRACPCGGSCGRAAGSAP